MVISFVSYLSTLKNSKSDKITKKFHATYTFM